MRWGSLETAARAEIFAAAAAERADVGEPPVVKVNNLLSLSPTKRSD